MELCAGANLGRYQLLAEIGRGAMGTVYQALDPEIDRLVAIKTFSALDPASAEGQEFRERFAQEARAAGRLMHPGIVTIYDCGEEASTDTPYIVMEYVPGQPLSQLLSANSARLEERYALQVARNIAEALSYAHEKGVVHRDIKPSNILINEEGVAKIADFGVARIDLSNLTLRGQILGTPAYMSPEQLTGGVVDGRSDIFSLGVILYTMLSGFRPFQGNGASTITFKVVNQQPVPVANFHLDLSKDAEYVVAHAMAKNPAGRYQTGAALAQDLADILDGNTPRSRRDNQVQVSAEVSRATHDYRALRKTIVKPVSRTTLAPASTTVVDAPVTTDAAILEAKPDSPVPAAVDPGIRGSVSIYAAAAFAVLALAIGLYAEQRNQLHFLDAQIGMPQALKERIATPAFTADMSEPIIEVALPEIKAPARNPNHAAAPDLDYTVIRNSHPVKAQTATTVAAAAPSTASPLATVATAGATPALLQFALIHHFAEAEVSVWVDDKLVFSGVAHAAAKKHLFVLRGGLEGRESHELRFPGGDHEVKVRVFSKGDLYDQSGTIHSNFREKQRALLEIRCNKRGIELKLTNGS
jgi:serine/threonine protein kinase